MRLRLCIAIVIALMVSLVSPPVQAEVQHPRQAWMRASTAGLFLHWGMFTAPKHLNCAEWERDVTGGGWNPDYWVDETRKLGASYLVLATFHSRLGYARPWPSKIPGSCATQRDLLGELVKAGKAKGVNVILYMTDDPQWHAEQGVEMLDSAAYSAYKGKQVDLTTRDGFGQYSYDLFFEVMDKYADLAGFWIDNDNEYWEKNRLYEQIREKRPTWLLSNNNEDTPIMDTVSNEQKTGMTPNYDYPQAAFTPMPRLTEACYKLPNTGDWWYDGGNHQVDTRLNVGRYITNAGSSMKSLMAETPMVNGKMPAQQEEFNNFMAGWLAPIRKSLYGTEGGGYMYGGMQPGFWNDGAHGVITVEPGAKRQYVHVVTRPRTDQVRLRDNGYRAYRVTDVRTGERLKFTQSGGYLTILGIKNWDQYDTVFQVDTLGQQFYYDDVRATASSSKDGFPASNLTDGSFEKYWDANGKQPVSITLDLGRRREASYLAVNQREQSPTHARVSFGRPEDSARIKDYKVYSSNDGRRWDLVRSGAMPSNRGTQFIEVGVHARYLKLEVLNTWAGPQAPRFSGQLAIDEIKVAHGYQRSYGTSLPLEAEHAALSGWVHREWCDACSGGFEVTGQGAVTFKDVTVAADGDYRLELDGSGTASLSVNGSAASEVTLGSAVVVPLKAGANTVKVSGRVSLDRIAVAPLPPESYTPKTTLTVQPHGVQWVGPGQQSVKVTAKLRLDVDDQIDQVSLVPSVPAGWTVSGAPATAASMRLGQELSGSWTLTSPAGADVGSVVSPVTASFKILGRAKQAVSNVPIQTRPANVVFRREAEDSVNKIGNSGLTGCGQCSGAEKVRNIGGAPDQFVLFENVTVPSAGQYSMDIVYTVNGPRSYFVSVNGGAPVEVKTNGQGNNTPYTTTIPVTLNAGANTIKFFNDESGAPDLDRISLS
ncbi:alpha-L-fucosidase [Lentzea sp. NBRC 105346]|uniref:alpha-L-fucosidase n=1 Tax=Lentzea sp. NBRC 105346 TaxID=3032205 RepID=UPI0024A2CA1C|nr:alpha-L-fucosidase [Lentzea sp. NBRC 105346]GLZ29051.1 alpha-L-fucosidase [Lentzea sp. NBRC 105346]